LTSVVVVLLFVWSLL